MGQEALKQKEQDLKEKEKQQKRAMLNRRVEEKKRLELQQRRLKEINALEEDRKKLNQQDPKQVNMMIPSESRIGTYTKREIVGKKQSVPNLLQGTQSLKGNRPPQNIPLNKANSGGYHHSNSVSSMLNHPAAQAQEVLTDENLSANLMLKH